MGISVHPVHLQLTVMVPIAPLALQHMVHPRHLCLKVVLRMCKTVSQQEKRQSQASSQKKET
eukprot:359094-Chlamydomonas_euryale.AAC.23